VEEITVAPADGSCVFGEVLDSQTRKKDRRSIGAVFNFIRRQFADDVSGRMFLDLAMPRYGL